MPPLQFKPSPKPKKRRQNSSRVKEKMRKSHQKNSGDGCGIDAVFDIQGSSCLIPRPSRLSLLYYPGLPPSAHAGSPDACTSQFLPHRYWPSGRGNKPLATPVTPLQSASCGDLFRRLVRSLSLRPSWLLAPWADQTREAQCPPGHPGLLHPGFQVAGSPRAPAGYDYEAKPRIASAGLTPASTAASLAAPPPWIATKSRPGNSTKTPIAHAATWKTASRTANSICSPIA